MLQQRLPAEIKLGVYIHNLKGICNSFAALFDFQAGITKVILKGICSKFAVCFFAICLTFHPYSAQVRDRALKAYTIRILYMVVQHLSYSPHFEGRIHRAINYGLSRRSEEHTSELQSLMRISYAVFCLKKNK